MKRTGCIVLGIVVLLVLVVGGMLMGKYNTIVRQNETINNAWAQVKVVLQRRADLIPNLVETVKGYATHEREVFENVAQARAKLAGATTPQEAAAANAGLSSALGRLLAIAEAYPDLKANQNFIRLQDELSGTENRIAVERRAYNETVRAYNAYIKTFPTNIIAGMFSFGPREYFESDQSANEAPKVKF
ncbi:MAG TPA: LemA family protein [Candidatus Polarisedimenticolia bacterium]|nr:LemA family protein [Candidatus Polarisedimenticolia bacterium]